MRLRFGGISRTRSWHLLLVLVLLGATPPAFGSDQSRLLIYLEVPGSPPATTLFLTGLELRGENRAILLPLETRELVASDLAGNQILLSSAVTPPGFFHSLDFDLSGITGQVGVAGVVPRLPQDGVAVPVDLHLSPGETRVVFLEWHPSAVDPEADFHSPVFEVVIPRIPPLGSLAFATSGGCGSVVVLDRQKARVVAALGVDKDPRGLAYSRNHQVLYVALADQDAIAVVDVLSLRVINTVPLQFGDDPSRLLLSADEATLYVLCPGSRSLVSLSAWSLQQQFRLAIGDKPRSLAQDPVSGFLYVACEDEGRIQVVDPGSGSITGSLALLSAPVEVVVDDQSRLLFLGGSAQRSIRSFDLATETGGGDINICGPVAGLAVSPRTHRLYASVPGCRNLAVIRPDLGIEFSSISLPGRPGLMAFDKEYRQLWVVLPDEGALAVCSVNRSRTESVIQVDANPYEVLLP